MKVLVRRDDEGQYWLTTYIKGARGLVADIPEHTWLLYMEHQRAETVWHNYIRELDHELFDKQEAKS